jgi:hypothetical protein
MKPSQEECDLLHSQAQQLVARTLRGPHSPSLNVRAEVQCQPLADYYKMPLSGVNQLDIDFSVASELQSAFPGFRLRTVPLPDGSQVEYALFVPWECAFTTGRGGGPNEHRPKRAHRFPEAQSGGGGLERLLILLLAVEVLAVSAWIWVL